MKAILSGLSILAVAFTLFFAHFTEDTSDAWVAALVALIAMVGSAVISYSMGYRDATPPSLNEVIFEDAPTRRRETPTHKFQ